MFDKAGRAPAYDDNLPEPGQIINDEQSSAIVIKYRDFEGNSIAKNDVLYGYWQVKHIQLHRKLYMVINMLKLAMN